MKTWRKFPIDENNTTGNMTAEDFIFNTAPYKKIIGEEYSGLYKELSKDSLSINGFNPVRGVDTTYHMCSYSIRVGHGYDHRNSFEPIDTKIRVLSFRCGRFSDILTLVVYCDTEEGCIIKIGTYPSLRDFHKDDIKQYEKVLS